jgi:hypothetical protein
MAPSLTLFFIVEPPRYQYLACYLAASIRRNMPDTVELVGYCPAGRMADLAPEVPETLRRLRCDLRPMETEGRFDPPYPHGNKILACLERRGTDYSGFLDSDILVIRKLAPEALVKEDHVSASAAASMLWAPQSIWAAIYGSLGMEVPTQRIKLMRDRRRWVAPYFSSGFVIFPETHRTPDGLSFPEVWMQTAKRIDAIPDLPKTRPYLDQMSLPLAIARSGLHWNELPEEHHFILGGKLRGQPLPDDRAISVVHYRNWDNLKEVGLAERGYRYLKAAVGVRTVRKIFTQPMPETTDPAANPPSP